MAEAKERLRKAQGQLEDLLRQVKSKRAEREEHEGGIFLRSAGNFNFPNLPASSEIVCRKTLRGHFGKIYAMQWGGVSSSPSDGPCCELVSASQDGKLIVWNAVTTLKQQAIGLESAWVMTCGIEQTEGKLVACGGLDNTVTIYRVGQDEDNETPTLLRGHDGYISCCRFLSPAEIMSSSGDAMAMLWNIETQQEKARFTGHSQDVMSISVCPTDPNMFVSGSCDATAKIWDVRTGFATHTFTGCESDVNAVQFMRNGRSFVVGSDDSTCRVLDVRSYSQFASFNDIDTVCGITSVDVSRSGRLLFAGYDDFNCFAWDVTKPAEDAKLYSLQDHENRVSCLGVDASGQALCTGSWDCLLKVFA
jgi:guanine nucleotide-binding protein G(I)/G(S)/G(T) subunit beta-1